MCIPQGSNWPDWNWLASALAAIQRVTVQVMSLLPDWTVGIWNAEPRPVTGCTPGFTFWNSWSANSVSGLPSTPLSQPMPTGGGGTGRGGPPAPFWEVEDWVGSLGR